ncbi:MAG: hypothetical protein ACOX52_04755 [Verrucomicrobiota bacterium]
MVENVTAPSAGGFPGPDGEVRLRMRIPFRTGSGEKSPATEVTENTEAYVFSYLNATRLK